MINRLLTCITKLRLYYLAIGAIGMSGLFSACEKDILEGQPEWLGNSIYERLEEGIVINGKTETFKTMLKIIDDLGQKEVLSKTGSKTIFAASDAAFEEWFRTNEWGVRSAEELSYNQKKTLLFNAMVNNAYLVDLMSNVPSDPPQQGLCMRRKTTAGIFDTIYTMAPEDMPVNPLNDPNKDLWATHRESGMEMKILKDNSTPTMIHFLPKFMAKNGITDKDLEIISNGRSTSINDSWVNGRKIISEEQTCKNGYIYVVDGVIEPNRNMAEIINHNPNTKLWAKMINRFSLPLPDRFMARQYNELYNKNEALYTLRYFSDWTYWMNEDGKEQRGRLQSIIMDQDTIVSPGTLLFDPGWNQYMYNNPMGFDLHYDAAAMIVPTDEAVMKWWNGPGLGLQQEYKSLDSIPLKVLSKLLRVHMLSSFIESVPSKFGSIVDDAKATLGITADSIKECEMGCNGVVYVSNTVFPPSEYRSVIYPALARESLMGVIYDAIDRGDFGAYLTARGPIYSMILPYNTQGSINNAENRKVFLRYIDPCTYGLTFQLLYEFYFDQTLQRADAKCYPIKMADDGTYTRVAGTTLIPSYQMIQNRLKDLVDNLIIIGSLNPEQKYYKTKAGSIIYVDYKDKDHVTFAGGFQQQYNQSIPSVNTFDMGATGNGISYGVQEAPLTSSLSLYQVLKNHAKDDKNCTCAADSAYRMFYELIIKDKNNGIFTSTQSGSNYECTSSKNNYNCALFDNYNYTVYIPTNSAIRAMIAAGNLPTWEDYDATKDESEKRKISALIRNFIRYHFQDNSIYIGGKLHDDYKSSDTESYETAKIDETTRRYYSLSVALTPNTLKIKDQLNRTVNVVTDKDIYNNTCREYWMECKDGQNYDKYMALKSSSNAVIHQIDDVLLYSKEQQSNWQSLVK